jgi:hypothetical protein
MNAYSGAEPLPTRREAALRRATAPVVRSRPDVKALLRLAVLYNVPTACNRSTADFMVASPLFHGDYVRTLEDHAAERDRLASSPEALGLPPPQ